MEYPSYKLEDFEATYDFYTRFQPNKTFAKLAYRLIRHLMQPEISFAPDTQEKLSALAQTPLILPINHLSNLHDQWTAAAIADAVIPERVGETHVLAKDAFFDGNLLRQLHAPQQLQPLATRFVSHMCAIPASRGKNHRDRPDTVTSANQKMFTTLGILQARGASIALYPESTHNYGDPEKILPIRPGIGQIALESLRYCKPALVPIGVSYGTEYTQIDEHTAKPARIRHAQAYIGEVTQLEPGMAAEDILDLTAHTLQDAVNHAHQLYRARTAA